MLWICLFAALAATACSAGSDDEENWNYDLDTATVDAKCGLAGKQAPIDIHTGYEPHGIDELRFNVSGDGDGCDRAKVKKTNRTWKVDFNEYCPTATKIRFRYNDDDLEYYAYKMEFRYPAEHTIDYNDNHVRHDMEAIIFFYKDGKPKIAISVLLDDGYECTDGSYPSCNGTVTRDDHHADNPFLARIWYKIKNPGGSYTMYAKPGELNFVDNFLPSLGMHFDYYFYKGTLDVPPCKESVKWVVMKHPVRISKSQLYEYTKSMGKYANQAAAHSDASILGCKKGAKGPSCKKEATEVEFTQVVTKALNKGGGDGPPVINRPKYSTARPLQDAGSRHPYDFKDEHCMIRSCHDVFSTHTDLNVMFATLLLLMLIVFTILFEASHHIIHHGLHRHRTAREMLEKIFKELAILGLVSFVVVALFASCTLQVRDHIREGMYVAFEYMHLLIFMVACFYVAFNGIVLIMSGVYGKSIDKLLNVHGEDLIKFVKGEHANPVRKLLYVIMGRTEASDLGFALAKHEFLKQHSLPKKFDFTKYFKYTLSRNLTESLDIGEATWVASFVLVVVVFETADITDIDAANAMFPIWGYVGVGVTVICLQWIRMSEKRMLQTMGAGPDGLELKLVQAGKSIGSAQGNDLLEAAQVSTASVDSSGHGHGGHGSQRRKSHGGGGHGDAHGTPSGERRGSKDSHGSGGGGGIMGGLKRRLSFDKVNHSKHEEPEEEHDADMVKKIEELKEKEEFAEKLEKSWVPFGTIGPTAFITEATSMLLCWYIGMYCLTYCQICTISPIFVVIPIALQAFLLVPAMLVQRSMCECITHPDSELIGEVREFMTNNDKLRAMLVDVLFPSFNETLTDPVDWAGILEVFDKFDDDFSFTISPGEFVHGLELMGLHLSPYKSARLLRLLDEDRSGEIETDELFEMVSKEKMLRTIQKVQRVFDYLVDPEEPGEVKFENLERLMKLLYDRDVTSEELSMAKAQLMDSEDDQHFNLKDFTAYIVTTVDKGRDLALGQMMKVQQQVLEKNAMLPKGQKKPSSAYTDLIAAAKKESPGDDDQGVLTSPTTDATGAELDQESKDLAAQRADAVGGIVP